jgi:hypothetical protein
VTQKIPRYNFPWQFGSKNQRHFAPWGPEFSRYDSGTPIGADADKI